MITPVVLLTGPGCKGAWDNIACWERAEIGEIITIPCPRVLRTVFGRNGKMLLMVNAMYATGDLTFGTELAAVLRYLFGSSKH